MYCHKIISRESFYENTRLKVHRVEGPNERGKGKLNSLVPQVLIHFKGREVPWV